MRFLQIRSHIIAVKKIKALCPHVTVDVSSTRMELQERLSITSRKQLKQGLFFSTLPM